MVTGLAPTFRLEGLSDFPKAGLQFGAFEKSIAVGRILMHQEQVGFDPRSGFSLRHYEYLSGFSDLDEFVQAFHPCLVIGGRSEPQVYRSLQACVSINQALTNIFDLLRAASAEVTPIESVNLWNGAGDLAGRDIVMSFPIAF
jgi:hypothetical protein